MSRTTENTSFLCLNCHHTVPAASNGSYRNHCPFCLYSLHVDHVPGDRLCSCKGLMQPVKVIYHTKKGYQVIHKCTICGFERANRVDSDSNPPDDFEVLLILMQTQY